MKLSVLPDRRRPYRTGCKSSRAVLLPYLQAIIAKIEFLTFAIQSAIQPFPAWTQSSIQHINNCPSNLLNSTIELFIIYYLLDSI